MQEFFLRLVKAIGAFFLLVNLSGCTATKFLKEGETFYDGAEIKIETRGEAPGKSDLKRTLEELLVPARTPEILGMRPAAWFYYSGSKGKSGFRGFLKKKLGKQPALWKDISPTQTAHSLEMQANNEGFFKSKVSFEVKEKKKATRVVYHVILERPYFIAKVNYDFLDTLQASTLTAMRKSSLLDEDQKYSLELLSAEQKRIEEVLENLGFYYFDDRYLLFKADTTVGDHKVDLDLLLEPGIPARAIRKYMVREITVFPFSFLTGDSLKVKGDTARVDGFRYIDARHDFRPRVITDVINLKPDSVYKRVHHEYTLSHLMGLNAFKFVNIKYRRSRKDSAALSASIYLTPLLKRSFRLQVQGVSKSSNFVGPGIELTLTNRNLLRGAEMFRINTNASYEMQIRSKQTNPLNAIEFGAEASLTVPRFIAPFKTRFHSSKYLPQTQLKTGYGFQQRLGYFRLNSFNVSGGYAWRETVFKAHELFPVDVTFVQKSNTSAEFDRLLKSNAALNNAFQNQFILGTRYSYTINTQLKDNIGESALDRNYHRSDFYFNGSLDLSGNFSHAIQSVKFSTDGPFTFFNEPYSQYIRGTLDFRYYRQLNRTSRLATRLITGIGYALGNSNNLPYIKQFSAGGSNSLRAFPARSVGPGTYNFLRNDTTYFIDQRGDIKLEGNVEYRFDIVKALKGACFVDAGNIWLVREDSLRVGGKFNSASFLSELAVGAGLGLRIDFNFFVLRFDLAFPVRKPYREKNDRWVFDEIDFRSRPWRRDNLVFNIAIGYPF